MYVCPLISQISATESVGCPWTHVSKCRATNRSCICEAKVCALKAALSVLAKFSLFKVKDCARKFNRNFRIDSARS